MRALVLSILSLAHAFGPRQALPFQKIPGAS